MKTSSHLAVIVIFAAYVSGIVGMLLWVGQAVGVPALGALSARPFLRFGWLLAGGLLLAFGFSRNAPGETWIGSQFLWLFYSFVGILVSVTAGAVCLLVGAWLEQEAFAVAAIALWSLGGLWFLYRWARGFRSLLRKQPVGRTRT